MTDKDEEAILLCGNPDNALPGSVEAICADCGCKVVHMPSDHEIPADATKVCVPCGLTRIGAHDEIPMFQITKQNEEFLNRLGWRMKKGTVH